MPEKMGINEKSKNVRRNCVNEEGITDMESSKTGADELDLTNDDAGATDESNQDEDEVQVVTKSFAIGGVPSDKRVAPNIFLRSALFALIAVPSQPDETSNSNEPVFIPCQDGYEIYAVGHRLDQKDQDIYLECMAVALANINAQVTFSHREILGALGISVSGEAVQRLRDRLNKMVSTALFLKRRDNRTGRWKTYSGNLLNWSEDSSGVMSIKINMDFLVFLQSDFTAIDWQERLGINSALAKWMHGYYSSHKNPFPINVRKVHELSGSTSTKMFSFRSELKKSMRELASIGFINPEKSGINKSDLLVIDRNSEPKTPEEIAEKTSRLAKKKSVKKIKPATTATPQQPPTPTAFDLLGDPILAGLSEQKKRIATDIFPPEFEQMWAIYPKRAGDNPKSSAYEQWKKRITNAVKGDNAEVMFDGVQRYAKYCHSTDRIGTEYVLQAKTFFGPNRRYADEWAAPEKKSKTGVIDTHNKPFDVRKNGFL